jgi:hypothetical protein
MSSAMKTLAWLAVVLLPVLAVAQPQAGSGSLIEKVKGTIDVDKGIEGLLIDSAKGSVSAASLAGIDADTVTAIENVRDFSLLINAFDRDGKGFGIAITPARTHFPVPRITLSEYNASQAKRLLGSLTFSYAQGKEDFNDRSFTRRAVSAATSAYWRAADDPVIVVARSTQCAREAFDKIPDKSAIDAATARRAVELRVLETNAAEGKDAAKAEVAAIERAAAGGDAKALFELDALEDARLTRLEAKGDPEAARLLRARRERQARESARVDEATEKAATSAFNTCIEQVLKKHAEKWNRSRYSVSLGTGSAKPTDGGGDSTRLGTTLAASVLYGFDGVSALQERAALALTYRRTHKDPVPDTLGTGNVAFKNSNLLAGRISGGSSTFRGLVELSHAKDAQTAGTERTMKRALGIDYRIMDGLWLNLRYGKQRKATGTGDETGSFLVLNYSPSALLGR